jgi:5'-nucleotidase (lipoprotein e(P4) family)
VLPPLSRFRIGYKKVLCELPGISIPPADFHHIKKDFMNKILILFAFVLGAAGTLAQDSLKTSLSVADLKLYPLLWQQDASEYRALCYQAFNIAALRLDAAIQKNPKKTNLAIITDLDETILDNSEIQAEMIKYHENLTYKKWLNWLNGPTIPTVPGGVEFLQEAGKKGVTIFYISNREIKGLEITLSILQKLKLPNVDSAHVLLVTDVFSKGPRIKSVMDAYNVVLLMGDNLNDFMPIFENKSVIDRFKETDKMKKEWGSKFIVLPNASYGEWENALFEYKDSLSDDQKISVLKSLLKAIQ